MRSSITNYLTIDVEDYFHVSAFEKASGREVPYRIAPRRAGDIATCWADPDLALRELNWQSSHTLDEMMRDTWNWQQKNPQGYKD